MYKILYLSTILLFHLSSFSYIYIYFYTILNKCIYKCVINTIYLHWTVFIFSGRNCDKERYVCKNLTCYSTSFCRVYKILIFKRTMHTLKKLISLKKIAGIRCLVKELISKYARLSLIQLKISIKNAS